jgi:hypothetical protein
VLFTESSKGGLPQAYDGLPLPETPFGTLSQAEEEEATFHTPSYWKDREYQKKRLSLHQEQKNGTTA